MQKLEEQKAAAAMERAEREAEQEANGSDETPVTNRKPKPKVTKVKETLAEKLLRLSQERKKRAREGDNLSAVDDVFGGGHGSTSDLFSEKNTQYRDSAFALDDERGTTMAGETNHYSTAVQGAALDLSAESAEDAKKARSVYAWSKSKNRYVKMAVNDAKAMTKGVKNEAGSKINFKTKQQHYIKWSKSSNMRIPDVGEVEDVSFSARALAVAKNKGVVDHQDDESNPMMGESRKMKGKKNIKSATSAEVDDDYVDISQPNAGKKLRSGRKQKHWTKDGHVKTFAEISQEKRKKQKEAAKLQKRQEKKKNRPAGKKKK